MRVEPTPEWAPEGSVIEIVPAGPPYGGEFKAKLDGEYVKSIDKHWQNGKLYVPHFQAPADALGFVQRKLADLEQKRIERKSQKEVETEPEMWPEDVWRLSPEGKPIRTNIRRPSGQKKGQWLWKDEDDTIGGPSPLYRDFAESAPWRRLRDRAAEAEDLFLNHEELSEEISIPRWLWVTEGKNAPTNGGTDNFTWEWDGDSVVIPVHRYDRPTYGHARGGPHICTVRVRLRSDLRLSAETPWGEVTGRTLNAVISKAVAVVTFDPDRPIWWNGESGWHETSMRELVLSDDPVPAYDLYWADTGWDPHESRGLSQTAHELSVRSNEMLRDLLLNAKDYA